MVSDLIAPIVPKPEETEPQRAAITSEIIWGVAINAAPRPVSSLQETIDSITAQGWQDVVIFAEPGTTKATGAQWVERPETIGPAMYTQDRLGPNGRFGAWQNFVQTMSDMLVRFPDANTLMYVQDDVKFSPGTKSLLERDLWPSHRTGIVSPYCPNFQGYRAQLPSLRRVNHKNLMGALCYVMPRQAVVDLLALPLCQTWKGAVGGSIAIPWQRKALDAFAGHAMQQVERKQFFYTHSLVEHFSPLGDHVANSAVANGRNIGFRKEFSRVKVHACDHFTAPWVKWSNAGEQVFPPKPEISTDPIHVIIPGYGLPDITLRCLDALATSSTSVNVCYVDNGSEDADYGRVVERIHKHWNQSTIIRNKTNKGFTHAINQGLRHSQGRHVLVLNNDCRVSSTMLEQLRLHLEWHPKVASCCPITNDQGLCSLKHLENRLASGISRAASTPNETQAMLKRVRVDPRPVLPWFCCLLNRDAVQEVPQLPTDPDIASGLAVDDWWCRQVNDKGWQHLICYDAYAEHDHRTTFKAAGIDRKSEQKKASRWLHRHSK